MTEGSKRNALEKITTKQYKEYCDINSFIGTPTKELMEKSSKDFDICKLCQREVEEGSKVWLKKDCAYHLTCHDGGDIFENFIS
jgi:hypothetical protein